MLLATVAKFNEACSWLAAKARADHAISKYDLQRDYYRDLRAMFGLGAQMAVRVIGQTFDAYKRDKTKCPKFRPHAAMPYDQRILTFKAADRVSILTVDGGRQVMPYVTGSYHAARLAAVRRQADLVLRKGRWYIYVTVEVPDGTPIKTEDWLGVDLGIRNLAVDSDGQAFSGAVVDAARDRIQTLRGALQAKGTKSAKNHLKRLSGREARFRSHTNHTISKRLVRKAQDTDRGIAMEDLHGIRDRVTVRRDQRARHGGWAFFQLRAFVTYKALLAGVRLAIVDPRNTSRTCPECGRCERGNRRSVAEFVCKSCGYAADADWVGAVNIARRARVNEPIVSIVKLGSRNHSEHLSSDQGQSSAL